MGGDGFWWGPASRTRPLFCPGAVESWMFPYHLISPRLVETKSFGQSAVCHGAKNGNHGNPGLFHGEPFFFIRATISREDDTGTRSIRESETRSHRRSIPWSRVQCVNVSSWTEQTTRRRERDFLTVWCDFNSAVRESPTRGSPITHNSGSASRCWPIWHRRRLVNSTPSYNLSRSRRCTGTWWVSV